MRGNGYGKQGVSVRVRVRLRVGIRITIRIKIRVRVGKGKGKGWGVNVRVRAEPKAIDTEIEEDNQIVAKLGVDLARFGEDESKIYINRGGKLRKYAEWSKATAVESANRIHQAALETGVQEVLRGEIPPGAVMMGILLMIVMTIVMRTAVTIGVHVKMKDAWRPVSSGGTVDYLRLPMT